MNYSFHSVERIPMSDLLRPLGAFALVVLTLSTMIVQKAGILHADSLLLCHSTANLHFQLQLGMKLLPEWVS
jgi:hypothetical protein